jgi:DNA polymerase-1
MADKLYVVDGMAYAFRSYFAIRNLRDSKGRPVNAVFGFARMLLKILREHEPSHVVIVFDAPGKTFRDDLYPEYKSHRPDTPEDLIAQFPMIDEIIAAFDVPVVRVPGVEADDVLATLAREAESMGMEAVLISGDKDILQAITEKTKVFDPSKGDKGVWIGPAEVKERFGAGPPGGVIDALALMGDSTDNVPGVKGIGEKTAKTLIEKYGDLDHVYAHLHELKGKQKENLAAEKENAYLSRELVTLKCDVAFDHRLDDFRRRELNRAKLAEVFAKFEFRALTAEFLDHDAGAEEKLDYRLVLDKKTLAAAIKEMEKAGAFAVDTETTSEQPVRAELVGISLSCKEQKAWYIPVGHTDPGLLGGLEVAGQIPKAEALALLKPLLENEKIHKMGQNIKYDYIVLYRAGVEIRGITMDTMLASYLTEPSRLRHNLSELSLKHLKRKTIPITDLIGTGSQAITFDQVPLEAACAYASEDADLTWRLSKIFQAALRERELESLFNEVEIPLIGVLARMEMAGIAIDPKLFEGLQKEIEGRLGALEREIVEMAGGAFQINSPKQLQKVLFEDLGLAPVKKTKTGYSTDVDVLEELAQQHPLPEKILEFRTLEKLRGTYVNALPKLVNPKTGRIHTSFNQAVAATGRLSSSDPNLQNIPIRTELGRRIRQGFVPGGPGLCLISADYSQIELRILAQISGDAALRDAFRKDLDVHRDTAARVFGVPPEQVNAEMRRRAKAVNFGVIYGISAFGLARNIGVGRGEAQKFIDHYFAQYPGVKTWLDQTIEEARTKGYVKTLMGRRRYLPEITASDRNTRSAAERMAVNAPVQGTAADIIKVAMIRLDKALAGARSRLLLQVHDELVVEAPEEDAPEVARTMKAIMENAMKLDVPLKVDVGIGKNWAEIH